MIINFEKFAAMVASKGELSLSFSMMNGKLVVKAAVKAPTDKKLSDEEEKALSPIALTGAVADFQEKFEALLTDYLTLGKELVELPDPVKTVTAKKKDLKSVIEKRKADAAKKIEEKKDGKGEKPAPGAKVAPAAQTAQPALFDLEDMSAKTGDAPAPSETAPEAEASGSAEEESAEDVTEAGADTAQEAAA